LEALAEVINILTFGHELRGLDVVAKVDSQVLWKWLHGGRIAGLPAGDLLVYRTQLLATLGLDIIPSWVPRLQNKIADAATHDDESEVARLATLAGFATVIRVAPDSRAAGLVARITQLALDGAGV